MLLYTDIKNFNRKTIVLTESQMFDLLIEAASIKDIHDKYYQNIPYLTYEAIISSDPTYNEDKPDKMGKYGKWLLALYQKGNLHQEDLDKVKEYLSYFVKFNNKIEQKDISKVSSVSELYDIVRPFIEDPEQATSNQDAIRKIKAGADKVYEDDRWLVIVPNTEEAACYYGKGTQWCTAATESDNRFDWYNKEGKLYINIDKQNNHKYQFHFEIGEFNDERNERIDLPVDEELGLSPSLVSFYADKYGAIAAIGFKMGASPSEMIQVKGLNNYYIWEEQPGTLYYYDDNVFDIYDVETCECGSQFFEESIVNRFIPTIFYDTSAFSNIFDTRNDSFVFDESDDIEYCELLCGYDSEILLVTFNDYTKGLYNLNKKEFIETDMPEDCDVRSISKSFRRSNLYSPYYKEYAIVIDENSMCAVYSLTDGKYVTDFIYKNFEMKREIVKRHFLTALYKENYYDSYSDIDVLLPNGYVISLSDVINNPTIMENFFS